MIVLIIQILLLSAILVMAFFCQRQNVQITEKLREANKTYRYAYRAWPRLNSRPKEYFGRIIGANVVGVYAGFDTEDGHRCDVLIKLFFFTPKDRENKEFAIRQAEELIEKLNEK